MRFGRGSRRTRVGPSALAAIVALPGLLLSGCDGKPERRITEIYELKEDPTPDNLQRIRDLLDDPNGDVRATAIFALTEKDPAGARGLAVEAMGDADGFVRATAARCLAELGDPGFVSVLARHLTEDADWHVRQRAAEALAEIGGDPAAEAVLPALEDPIKEVRLAAAKAVAELGPQFAVPRLSAMVLDDPEWEIRVQAAGALGRTADPTAVEALEAAVDDRNEFVRASASRALAELRERLLDMPPEGASTAGPAPEGSSGEPAPEAAPSPSEEGLAG